ncbi:hypothetical protein DAPPUDRAFT_250757 [Daphnia pulex]|uniref:Caspase family p20 domain-containing protein n=1 Tax=Daphnia pulex TaxID=6669 RepID=E9GZ83_DAPPU|nr:hypothetical protein DAPPUDRAFT_250757 [Daphnia pulex]|eukprot:EFX75202.1 hypothetical protein DAPPUDRAFT_250757 [Daphnia pulex]
MANIDWNETIIEEEEEEELDLLMSQVHDVDVSRLVEEEEEEENRQIPGFNDTPLWVRVQHRKPRKNFQSTGSFRKDPGKLNKTSDSGNNQRTTDNGLFEGLKCPEQLGKPKIFFTNICRAFDVPTDARSRSEEENEGKLKCWIRIIRNFRCLGHNTRKCSIQRSIKEEENYKTLILCTMMTLGNKQVPDNEFFRRQIEEEVAKRVARLDMSTYIRFLIECKDQNS